ncbi:Homocysteine s-methyltransferase [Musa troglodytarum]|uniref:homocysteine S-methyltransferase n=2 Tax=Musa troglodytarum TaxID=320322 RepID=A0A9E7HPY1_9LILI|nr:Homocysteine s-methyltransferase [Musa troglodytarum]
MFVKVAIWYVSQRERHQYSSVFLSHNSRTGAFQAPHLTLPATTGITKRGLSLFPKYPRASLAASARMADGEVEIAPFSPSHAHAGTRRGTGFGAGLMREFLREAGGCAVIDGGLATELEAHGADLKDPLWSAKYLCTSPDLIKKVHLDYLEAGANILITASYQATIQGFESRGFSREESEALLRRSVELACEARGIFQGRRLRGSDRCSKDGISSKQHPVLIAASIGSYGAYLADGSEYSGNYGLEVTLETLKDFHRRRLQVLSEAGADIIAFETIPSKIEAQAYIELLQECNIKIPVWFSFTSNDGINIVSGDSLMDCASIADSCDNVVAIGFNCTSPRYIHSLILSIRKLTEKLILIYPNSGESYDPDKKEWVASNGVSGEDFVSYVSKWHEAGASLIGGCCRTTPNTIRAIAKALRKDFHPSKPDEELHNDIERNILKDSFLIDSA